MPAAPAFKRTLDEVWPQTCIGVMKDAGAQGMIFWDVEGDEMPHAITYLWRSAHTAPVPPARNGWRAPMNSFAQFRAAGP